jgi:capsid protein
MKIIHDMKLTIGVHLGNEAGHALFTAWRAAFLRCVWVGPPKGWVNPVDERAGAILGMDAGLSTLEEECLAQGTDFEEVLAQRAYEIKKFDELGIPRPEWAGLYTAVQASKKPEDPKAA